MTTTEPTTFEQAVAHRDAMLDVFTEITQDCVLLGLKPCLLNIHDFPRFPLELGARVQIKGDDTAAVNALADAHGLDLDGGKGGNYSREGVVEIGGRQVELCVYTGRPKHPVFPASYAPQAVEATPHEVFEAVMNSGAPIVDNASERLYAIGELERDSSEDDQ